jgi:hypothetical protein
MLLSRGAAYAFNPWPTPPMRQDAQNSEAGALQNTTAAGK